MKKLSLFILSCLLSVAAFAQSSSVGKIVLTPYVESSQDTPQADKILLDKLSRIVTQNGMVGNGLSTPFIITAHAIELDKTQTATAPVKTVVNLSVTVYIGNGDDGTLFSSCNFEVKGIGGTTAEAYASAYRKININNPELGAAIQVGKERVSEYYNANASDIISRAKAQAAAGQYDDAYNSLLSIPSICDQYEQAQVLIAKYSKQQLEASNLELITKARAAWSASPTEAGAAEAEGYIGQIESPSDKVTAQATTLLNEISSRLQRQQAQERADRLKAQQNAHSEKLALINGAAKVAAARAASRPRVVYNIHWW